MRRWINGGKISPKHTTCEISGSSEREVLDKTRAQSGISEKTDSPDYQRQLAAKWPNMTVYGVGTEFHRVGDIAEFAVPPQCDVGFVLSLF